MNNRGSVKQLVTERVLSLVNIDFSYPTRKSMGTRRGNQKHIHVR